MSFVPSYAQIRNLLNENAVFLVPRYQRNYVWGIDEWKNLLEDIKLVVDKNALEPENKVKHFIGSFIFEKRGTTWDIVDGQQRLSTISILLSCIAKRIRLLDDDSTSNAFSKYFFYTNEQDEKEARISNGSDLYKLFIAKYYISDSTINNFSELISKENVTVKKSDFNFRSCIIYFEQEIDNIILHIGDVSDKKKLLEEYRDAILDLDVIQIIATDKNSGYIIFQVLNSRGKPLETFELVKNYIFTYIKVTNGSDTANSIWEEVLSNTELDDVTNASIDRFFTNYIVHKYGKTSKRREFSIVVEHTPKTEVKNLLDDLKEKSKMYKRICTGQGFSNNNINYILTFLNKNKITQFRPVLLSLFENLSGNDESIKKLEKILISIKNFLSIYVVIMKGKTNKLEKIIYKYAKEFHDSYSDELCREFLTSLYAELQTKTEFTSKFNQLAYSKDKSWYPGINVNLKKEILHVLTELEIHETSSDDRIPQKFTLEHIKDDAKLGRACFIGNLIPLSYKDNKATNGKTLSEKMNIYDRSAFTTPRKMKEKMEQYYIGTGNYWNDGYIDGNTTRLANIFYDTIWVNKF